MKQKLLKIITKKLEPKKKKHKKQKTQTKKTTQTGQEQMQCADGKGQNQ